MEDTPLFSLSQDRINNSLNFLPHSSYDVSFEDLLLL